MIEIVPYTEPYKKEVIDLILSIQNDEYHINLSLQEQPDLKEIPHVYQEKGGEFWLALADGQVVGTIALLPKEKNCGILKKFFVHKAYRKQKIGLLLYQKLLQFAQENHLQHLILDTPSVAKASHHFYERAGFYRIEKKDLPVPYDFPDRDSYLYLLDL